MQRLGRLVPPARRWARACGGPTFKKAWDQEAPRQKLQLHVSNLARTITEEDVNALFSSNCKVISVYMPKDKSTKLMRCFAYVVVADFTHLESVCEKMNGMDVQGRPLKVAIATAQAPKRAITSGGIALNFDIVEQKTTADVLRLTDLRLEDLNDINIVTAIYRIGHLHATFKSSQTPSLMHLADRAASHLLADSRKFGAQELSNVVWGLAKVKVASPSLFSAVSAVAVKKMANFNPRDLAHTCWACATVGFEAPQLFDAIACRAEKKIDSYGAQDMSNTAWAFARAGVTKPSLFEALAKEAPRKLGKFTSQGLSNLLWAFAKARHQAPDLFAVIASDAADRLKTGSAQGLCNVAWAYASAQAPKTATTTVFTIIAQALPGIIKDYSAQDLAITAWAASKVKAVEAPQLVRVISAGALLKMDELNAQNLSNLAWALARERVFDTAVFESIAEASMTKMETFTSQNLANLAWAFSTAGIEPVDLFQGLISEVSRKRAELNVQEVAMLLWALRKHENRLDLFETFAIIVDEKMSECNADELWLLHEVYASLRDHPDHALVLVLKPHAGALEYAAAGAAGGPAAGKSNEEIP